MESDSDGGPDSVPARVSGKTSARKSAQAEGNDEKDESDGPGTNTKEGQDEDEDEDEEEGDEDEYTVEKIIKHDFDEGGNVIYLIKWLGYEKASDRTWEPKEHLDSAKELLDAYHDSVGGEPHFSPPVKMGGKGRKRASTAADDSTQSAKKARGRKSNGTAGVNDTKSLDLPIGSWETEVIRVTGLENSSIPGKNGKPEERLIGYLEWRDPARKRTQHPLRTLRQKCPQALLDYYEMHLKFTEVSDPD